MPAKFFLVASATAALALAACAHSSPPAKEAAVSTTGSSMHMMPVKQWPLRFSSHSFSVFVYDAYGAKVNYAGPQIDRDPDTLAPSSASYGPDYQRNWNGIHAMIRNFPPPANVRWRSKDGQPHEAEIDIGEIFKDELIRHNVAREDMADVPDGMYASEPSILLEVNDRTIRVWMRSMIFLKRQTEVAGVMRSDFKYDLILAWTHTY